MVHRYIYDHIFKEKYEIMESCNLRRPIGDLIEGAMRKVENNSSKDSCKTKQVDKEMSL